jgi:ATP-dependent DNA helicase RecQ
MIKTFGVGKDQDRRHWRMLVDNLLAQGLIAQTTGDYPVLQLLPASRDVLFGEKEVSVLKTLRKAGKRSLQGARLQGEPYDEDLFEKLRSLRKELASEQGVPPFVIFSDRTLHEMACHFPTTKVQLLAISGVGETKLSRYGTQFMEAIEEFQENTTTLLPGRGDGM